MTKAIKSTVAKRSVVIGGHKTSVSLEEPFWNEVRSIAEATGVSVSGLLQTIDSQRQNANLSSAIRVFVLQHWRDQAEAPNEGQPAAAPRSAPMEIGL